MEQKLSTHIWKDKNASYIQRKPKPHVKKIFRQITRERNIIQLTCDRKIMQLTCEREITALSCEAPCKERSVAVEEKS